MPANASANGTSATIAFCFKLIVITCSLKIKIGKCLFACEIKWGTGRSFNKTNLGRDLPEDAVTPCARYTSGWTCKADAHDSFVLADCPGTSSENGLRCSCNTGSPGSSRTGG